MTEEALGEKIKQARLRRKWSQERLAEQLGISARTVIRWETKGELPNLGNQQLLIELLGLEERDFQRVVPQQVESLLESATSEKAEAPSSARELERMLPPKEEFKLYCGRRIVSHEEKYPWRTTYVTVNGRRLPYFGPDNRTAKKETLFEWGYQGAGPRTLAQAILADYLGEQYPKDQFATQRESNALLFGTLFKEDMIATLSRKGDEQLEDDWQISSTQIRHWFYALEAEGITRTSLLRSVYGEQEFPEEERGKK